MSNGNGQGDNDHRVAMMLIDEAVASLRMARMTLTSKVDDIDWRLVKRHLDHVHGNLAAAGVMAAMRAVIEPPEDAAR